MDREDQIIALLKRQVTLLEELPSRIEAAVTAGIRQRSLDARRASKAGR